MALSLAACGGSSTPVVDTPVVDTPVVDKPVVDTPVAPVVNTITKALLDFASGGTLAGTDGDDLLDIEINADLGATTTISGVETIELTSYGAHSVDFTKITDVTKFVASESTGNVTLAKVADAAMELGFAGAGTNNITAGYKSGALDGSADVLNVELATAKAVTVSVDAGFESINVTTTGKSDIDGLTVPGVSKITMDGAGALDIANTLLDGFGTVDASGMTGALTTGTVSTTTGYAADDIVGKTTGSTVKLGSGDDSIGFTAATSASTSTDSIKLGAGDDQLVANAAGSGALVVMGEAGDDQIKVVTSSLTSADVLNGGEGTDTVLLSGDLAHSLVLRGVENLTIDGTAASRIADVVSADSALKVTYNMVAADDVNVTSLTAGSTVAVNAASTTTAAAAKIESINVDFEATEAATTVDVNVALADNATLEVTNVTAVTFDFAQIVAEAAPTGDIEVNDATSLKINAAKDFFMDDLLVGGGKLTSLTIDGSDKVEIDDLVNSTVLTSVNVKGADDVSVGAVADADKVATYTVVSTAGSVTTDEIGDAGATSKDPENISITLSAGTTVTAGEIEADDLGDVTISGADGTVAVAGITSADDAGTISITASKGAIDLGDGTLGLIAADTTGMTVNLSATTFISDDGANVDADAVVTNTDGDITATLSGAAAANVNYTAGTVNTAAKSGTVSLNASALTGGLTTTITSHEMETSTATQLISLGAKTSATVNTVTLVGYTSSTTVNGSIGADTIINSDGGDVLSSSGTNSSDTYIGNGGADTISYAGNTHDALSGTNDAGATTDGYAFNTSGSAYTFFSTAGATTTNKTTIDGHTVAQYDSTATASTTATAGSIVAGGETDSVTGFETFVGSAQADYFIANSAGGQTFEGGAGADTFVLAAGADTLVFALDASTEAAHDEVVNFAVASDVLDFTATVLATDDADVNVGTVGSVADAADFTSDIVDGIMTITAEATASASEATSMKTLANYMDAAEIAVETTLTADAASVLLGFEVGGHTYVSQWSYVDSGTAATLENLVQLTDLTGIIDLATTAAANTVVIA